MGELLAALVSPPPPEDVVAPFWLLYLLTFAVGFVLSAAADGDALAPLVPRQAVRTVLARYSRPASALFGAGLVLFGIRVLRIDPLRLAAPIWLLLCLLAVVAYLAWAGNRLRREIPGDTAVSNRGTTDPYRRWPSPLGDDPRRSVRRR